MSKGHGRHERRAIRLSGALAGYSALPGLAQVAEVSTRVTRLATGETSSHVRYLVTSLPPERAGPARVLALSRGHWGIENRLLHVADDSFGEDRQVLQTHAAGAVMSLLRATAVNLLRGACRLWTTNTQLTARAEWVNGRPAAVLATLAGL